MSDKQYGQDRTRDFDGLSDDDPLTALARVGMAERPIVVQRDFSAGRHTPEFNLEDELLRAFEVYDTPRPDRAFVQPEPLADKVASQEYPIIEPEPQWEALVAREVFDEPVRGSSVYQEFEPKLDETSSPLDDTLLESVLSSEPDEPLDEVINSRWPPNLEATDEGVGPDWETLFAQFKPDALKESDLNEDAVFVSQQSDPAQSVAEPVADPEVIADAVEFEPDELLDEMKQFPFPAVNPDWMRPSAPQGVEGMDEATVDAAVVLKFPEQSRFIGRQNWPSFSPPSVAPFEPVDEIPEIPEAALPELPARREQVILADNEDPFEDYNFELDIGAIEMDLADLEDHEPVTPLAARVDRWQPDRVNVTPIAPSDAASTLPFDPAQIGQTEDPFLTIAEMDVPDLPVDEETPVSQPDYDIDIDTEMARMFTRPVEEQYQAAIPDRNSVANPAPGAYAPSDQIDEFERALEEDFHRSLAPEIAGTGAPDRVKLMPSTLPYTEAPPRQTRRLLLVGSSVAALVLLGGGGLYAYFSTGTSLMPGTSEPRIILADKSPVKQVPENKGGRTVPNQDKAVYDRVAGAANEIPKQENLVSSTEEPVDVVQKTLIPENLPMDDDTVATTPTGDTVDARLLPDAEANEAAIAGNPIAGVQVRKVQTMIVRPDGTLVPRAEPTAQPAPPETVGGADVSSPGVQADVQADDEAASSNVTTPDIAATPNEENPTEIAAADGAAAPDTRTANSVVPAENTPFAESPVPASEPATQEDQGNGQNTDPQDPYIDPSAIKAAAQADVPDSAPIRVVKTTKITANTPVPQSRPVDQPVNVVSTINEQGITVASQQVASVRPQESPTPQVQVSPQVQVQQQVPVSPQVQVLGGSYVIQIASLPSEGEAQRSYEKLSGKFGNVIGGRGVDIRRAEIAGKGTYYRLRIPAGSKEEAVALCSRYKEAGGSCLVSR